MEDLNNDLNLKDLNELFGQKQLQREFQDQYGYKPENQKKQRYCTHFCLQATCIMNQLNLIEFYEESLILEEITST